MNQRILLLILLTITIHVAYGQTISKTVVAIDNRYLLAGVDNPIEVIARQETPLCVEQFSVVMHGSVDKKDVEIRQVGNSFIIRPKRAGIVKLTIDLGDTIEIQELRVKTITPVGRLGKYKANSNATLGVGEMKAQRGVLAIIECCGFDAKCTTVSYEVVRVSKQGEINKIVNTGGRFKESTQKIIQKASSGDMYIFRKIKYRCPGMVASQDLENMIFDVK